MTTFFETVREVLHSIHNERFSTCCPPGETHIRDCLARARLLFRSEHPPSNASAAAIFFSDSLDTDYSYDDLSLLQVFAEAHVLDEKAFPAGVQFATNEFNQAALSFVDRVFELRSHALRVAGSPLALAVAAHSKNQVSNSDHSLLQTCLPRFRATPLAWISWKSRHCSRPILRSLTC